MPLIQMKTTLPLDEEIRAELTAEFGRLMGIAGKPESFLMVGLEERCDLRFAGKPMEKGALIAMQQVGELSRDVYEKLTAEICRFLEARLGIDPKAVYITYQAVNDWGWNGTNF